MEGILFICFVFIRNMRNPGKEFVRILNCKQLHTKKACIEELVRTMEGNCGGDKTDPSA